MTIEQKSASDRTAEILLTTISHWTKRVLDKELHRVNWQHARHQAPNIYTIEGHYVADKSAKGRLVFTIRHDVVEERFQTTIALVAHGEALKLHTFKSDPLTTMTANHDELITQLKESLEFYQLITSELLKERKDWEED